MQDFKYYAPTEVVFGKDAEEHLVEMINKYGGKKVLVHYGGHSAERSGLLASVREKLNAAGIAFVELGGVKPNPRLTLVNEGIELCRKENVDFILAVGGGSVIDSSKAIGYGVKYDGDVWDIYARKYVPTEMLPVGVILTIPAAGSEMSDSSVITKEDGDLKIGYSNNICRPKFAIMNPVRTFTLPPYQTACGATDIMMHTMERYFGKVDDMTLIDNIAEALMRTVKDSVFHVLKNPEDYRNRACIMWASSLGHNDLTGDRSYADFATHQIEHELSAMFDVAHGAGLAAVWPSWARYVMDENVSRFARFAVNVMGVPHDFTDTKATAMAGVEAVEKFYRAIGMPTNIHELIGREITDDEIKELARKCSHDDGRTIGGFKKLDRHDMEEIYKMAR